MSLWKNINAKVYVKKMERKTKENMTMGTTKEEEIMRVLMMIIFIVT